MTDATNDQPTGNAQKAQDGEFDDLNLWYRTSGETAETDIGTGLFGDKPVTYSVIGEDAIFEGDILLGRIDELENPQTRGIGRTGSQFRWPGGVVPFVISPDLPNPGRVTAAITHWHQHTNIKLVPRTTEKDFISFEPGGGCASHVGRIGGKQVITLAPGCGLGSTIHEIGHAVGLWHEQSREDREQFIEVVLANVQPAARHNFDQHIKDGDDLGTYDFGSIMHYPATAFSINGQPTIKPKKPLSPGVTLGQRGGLSEGDKAAVRALYPKLDVLADAATGAAEAGAGS